MKKSFKRMLFLSLSVLSLAGSGPIYSNELEAQNFKEIKLIDIISEPEDNLVHAIIVDLIDIGDIQRIIRRSTRDQTVFTPADILAREVVLARAADRDAVLLSCHNCGPAYGGILTLRYLNNGVTNSYKTFDMELVREGDEWSLFTSEAPKVKIKSLRLRARKVAGMLIGIRKIDVNE